MYSWAARALALWVAPIVDPRRTLSGQVRRVRYQRSDVEHDEPEADQGDHVRAERARAPNGGAGTLQQPGGPPGGEPRVLLRSRVLALRGALDRRTPSTLGRGRPGATSTAAGRSWRAGSSPRRCTCSDAAPPCAPAAQTPRGRGRQRAPLPFQRPFLPACAYAIGLRGHRRSERERRPHQRRAYPPSLGATLAYRQQRAGGGRRDQPKVERRSSVKTVTPVLQRDSSKNSRQKMRRAPSMRPIVLRPAGVPATTTASLAHAPERVTPTPPSAHGIGQ